MTKLNLVKILSIFIAFYCYSCFATSVTIWKSYIDGTVGAKPYYLYFRSLDNVKKANKLRALDLGSGAGNEVTDLVKNGWDVTGVDVSANSGRVIKERVKYLQGNFNFQQGKFLTLKLKGNYDLVISFFALPFGNKNNLPKIMRNISQHMQKGAVFTANFFGNNQSYVIDGDAFGISKYKLLFLLQKNHFNLRYFLHRDFKKRDFEGSEVRWDIFDIIAIKV